jgi:predicted transcriptional regulator
MTNSKTYRHLYSEYQGSKTQTFSNLTEELKKEKIKFTVKVESFNKIKSDCIFVKGNYFKKAEEILKIATKNLGDTEPTTNN